MDLSEYINLTNNQKLWPCPFCQIEAYFVLKLKSFTFGRSKSGCPCSANASSTDCPCCDVDGCQCSGLNQCVQCGHTKNCGIRKYDFFYRKR